ncbi:MAG: peptidylprolyl isomerase [Eubacterium sp.]|nr:peptidylprolyl isomerase [Eubacterium sp.]
MDEKEKNLYDDNPLEADVNQQNDDTLEERDGVKYETNDSWQFEAEAPTLSSDLFETDDNSENTEEEIAESENSVNEEPVDEDSVDEEAVNEEPLGDGETVVESVAKKLLIKYGLIAIAAVIVIAIVAVFGVRYFTVPNGKEGKMMNPASAVATVDGTKVSLGMYNLYFSSIVNQYEQYAYYGYYDLDPTVDYSMQHTTDKDGNEISWLDFFENEALEQIKRYTVYCNAAKEEGITLSQAQQDIIDEQIKNLKTSASEAEQSLDEYLSDTFGEYCTEATVRLYMEQYYVAANYIGKFTIDNPLTDEEITAYYDEHKSDYLQINFSYLATEYDSSSDEAKAESEKTVSDYTSKITDRQSILDLVPVVYKEYIDADVQSAMEYDETLSKEDASKEVIERYEENVDASIYANQSPFDDEINAWLFDESQPIGSVKSYIDSEAGYAYILLKTEQPTRLEDETYAVRHILIQPEADDDTPTDETTGQPIYTDEQWAAAEEKANKILEDYNNGEKTEYAFALLAEEYTTDTASTSAGSGNAFGGLYEAVTLGEMVPDFEAWATDKSRVYGDTGIVMSDYGYHIMFFIYDRPSYEAQVIIDARNAKLDSMIEAAELDLHESVINKANDKFLEAKKADNEAQAQTTDTEE